MIKSDMIGIFDSGIGGLTVAKAISKRLPEEQILYFGDTMHLPYGEKSPTAIREYAQGIVRFLLQKNVKMIVIACNSISSYAYDEIKSLLNGEVLLVDVIRPAVDYIIEKGFQKVGIIGTRATIGSDIHSRLLTHRNHELSIYPLATPLLVPMIEEGYFNNSISQEIIDNYLKYPPFENIDALLLACTHYPLIKNEIAEYFKHPVEVIDNAELVAGIVDRQLTENQVKAEHKSGRDEFYVSDYTHSFEQTAKLFFGQEVSIQPIDIWSHE